MVNNVESKGREVHKIFGYLVFGFFRKKLDFGKRKTFVLNPYIWPYPFVKNQKFRSEFEKFSQNRNFYQKIYFTKIEIFIRNRKFFPKTQF